MITLADSLRRLKEFGASATCPACFQSLMNETTCIRCKITLTGYCLPTNDNKKSFEATKWIGHSHDDREGEHYKYCVDWLASSCTVYDNENDLKYDFTSEPLLFNVRYSELEEKIKKQKEKKEKKK